MTETELKLLANMYAALDKAMPLDAQPAPPAPPPERDPDPTHWSNWRTRGDGYGDTAGGMPFKKGD